MTDAKKTKKKQSLSIDRLRETLVQASLPHIAFDGWSLTAFEQGAANVDLPATEVMRAFSGGIGEAFEWFSDDCDRRMAETLATRKISEMRVRDRITTAVRCRLELNTNHREAIRRGLAFLAWPQNGPLGMKCLYRTVDTMWRAAGDTSTDYNFYTKRLLLAGVVSSTTLYWLNDTSENFTDSWGFLDRRIADVMKVPGAIGRLKNLAANLPNPDKILRRFAR